MQKKYIKLSAWAKKHDYSYHGAYLLFERGGIPNSTKNEITGTILVEDTQFPIQEKEDHTVVYARVSSSENRPNLDTQAERVAQFCNAKGWTVKEIVKECASGLNDERPKLNKIFSDRKATRLVVEHKDRLTRFGYNYIRSLYPECEIVVINEVSSDKEDLLQDFVSLVTSFCARLYSKRRSKRKTEQLIKELSKEENERIH